MYLSILATARFVFHILVFGMAIIALVYRIKYIRFMCDNDVRKYFFLIRGSLAVRCCRPSLEGPACPSGSHVRLLSCSVNFYGDRFIDIMYKRHKP